MRLNKLLIGLSLFSLFVITFSCAKTEITSFKDPNANNYNISKILVIATNLNLPSRENLEEKTATKLTENGVVGISSLKLFYPTRQYSEEEYLKILDNNKIDGILILELSDAYSKQVYIPESYSSKSKGTVIGNQVNINTKTYKHGGYYLNKPVVHFNIELFNTRDGSLLWVGSSRTGGNAFADVDDLFDSLSETAIEKLTEDGLL